jgi:hypothetical protein
MLRFWNILPSAFHLNRDSDSVARGHDVTFTLAGAAAKRETKKDFWIF